MNRVDGRGDGRRGVSRSDLCRWRSCWPGTLRATCSRKCIGWREFEFVFNDLSARDEETELAVQVQLLQAGVLTVDEVRAMRGLGPLQRARAGNGRQKLGQDREAERLRNADQLDDCSLETHEAESTCDWKRWR